MYHNLFKRVMTTRVSLNDHMKRALISSLVTWLNVHVGPGALGPGLGNETAATRHNRCPRMLPSYFPSFPGSFTLFFFSSWIFYPLILFFSWIFYPIFFLGLLPFFSFSWIMYPPIFFYFLIITTLPRTLR